MDREQQKEKRRKSIKKSYLVKDLRQDKRYQPKVAGLTNGDKKRLTKRQILEDWNDAD